ncbi:MAG: hypothetical protein LCI03_20590 [Actinobacteria bacterium]|nr:hypothetical protein [Actinomycetota bacterium]
MNAETRRPTGGAAGIESAGGPAESVRRRRDAALRCEPLGGGRRDPWTFTRPDPSAASLRGSRAAWQHLQFLGLLDSDGYVEGILRDLGGAA